jgi:RimJ/RimL family protein N-acetyltransferase
MDLQGRRIYLRYCNEHDITLLFRWRNSEEFRSKCSIRRNKINLDDFKKELERDFQRDRHVQMMIIRKKDGVPIGTVYSYGYRKTDGYAFITIFLSREYQFSGYGIEAIALFLWYLFSEFLLFKIYMEVYEYNTQSLSCICGAGFAEEGRFSKHRLFKGIRYDLLRFAVYRDKNLQQIKMFLRRLKRGA